jgi:hypothetical protein
VVGPRVGASLNTAPVRVTVNLLSETDGHLAIHGQCTGTGDPSAAPTGLLHIMADCESRSPNRGFIYANRVYQRPLESVREQELVRQSDSSALLNNGAWGCRKTLSLFSQHPVRKIDILCMEWCISPQETSYMSRFRDYLSGAVRRSSHMHFWRIAGFASE